MVNQLLRRRIRSERGAELIEFALVLPILLLVIAGIADFALLFHRFLTLNNAVREGARVAVLPGYSPKDAQDRVRQYVREGLGSDTGLDDPVVKPVKIPDPPTGSPPSFAAEEVTAKMKHNYLFLGPVSGLLGGGSFSSITLSARATMRKES
jgi:Flp pilus assembly pilin Flp